MREDGKVEVTCPRCEKLRRVARYSVAAGWQDDARPALSSMRVRSLTCRTCTLIDRAAAYQRRLDETLAEIAERGAKGL